MFRQYRLIEKGEFFCIAVDTSSGGGDYTAGQFYSKTKLDFPLVYHSKVTTSDFIPLLAKTGERLYDVTGIKPVIALERNNGGVFLMDRLASINYSNKYELFKMPRKGNIEPQDAVKLGWETSTVTRPIMLQELKDAIDKRGATIYDRPTINELYSFIIVQTATAWKAQAEQHAHDDLVMAAAIALQMGITTQIPLTNNEIDKMIDELPEEKRFTNGFY